MKKENNLMEETGSRMQDERISYLQEITGQLKALTEICKSQRDMLKYLIEFKTDPHLDNCTDSDPNNPPAMMTEGSTDIMAKEHRIRVCVGYDDNGNAVTKRLSANDELSLADKVIEAVVRSGRIKDFLNTEIEFGPNELKLLEEAKQAQATKKTPFREYISTWRRTFKSGKAANTEVFLVSKENVLLRWFGEMAIEDITPSAVQDFLTHRAESYKKATVKADWAMLKEVLDSAVSDGIIPKNPAKDKRVHNPAKAGSGTASLTREQIAAIQRAIPTLEDARERCLIALLAYTSMRREEVLGLMWENVDFEKNVLEIRQAVVHPVSAAVTKETKNEFSLRTFPMSEALRAILFPCRKKKGYVIAEEDGSPLSSTAYGRLWKSLKSHIELYGMTAINFRTTFATMAVASGVDIKTTQALMGHATPEMTLMVYAKKEESRLPDAMEKLESFLAG